MMRFSVLAQLRLQWILESLYVPSLKLQTWAVELHDSLVFLQRVIKEFILQSSFA